MSGFFTWHFRPLDRDFPYNGEGEEALRWAAVEVLVVAVQLTVKRKKGERS